MVRVFLHALACPAALPRRRGLTLVSRDGVVEHVFYPVFPPDKNAEQVIHWFKAYSDPRRRR
jgi:peroxiredoxin